MGRFGAKERNLGRQMVMEIARKKKGKWLFKISNFQKGRTKDDI